MRRRRALIPVAAVLTALLTAGCVTQPMDETALTGLDPQLGATPAALDADDAERVADAATSLTQRKTTGPKHRDWIWTGPRPGKRDADERVGGLIRDDASEVSEEPARKTSDRPRRKPVDSTRQPARDPDATQEREQPRQPRDDEQPRDLEPAPKPKPPASPKPKPPAEPTFRAIAGVADASGDASGQSPAYADIRQLLVESDGRNARVTIAVVGDIPKALSTGEVQGIGVDFYRGDEKESDYQLFVDGDDEGWRAYLQTPDGIVQYPGSFGVGGRVFVFEVPWTSLGGRVAADVDMFIDWSKRRAPLNDSGNDRAPHEGRVRVDPA